ncbi:MAG: pilus assembly protein TadG-related protein, partial [Sphingomonadales bacterium]
MEKFVKLFWRRKDGAVLAYTAILMPIFLGFIALGFDIASWHLDKRRTQTMADSGAVAAAIAGHRAETEEGASSSEIATAANAAVLDAIGRNGFDAGAGETFAVNIPPLSGQTAGQADAIEVIVRTPLPLLLSALMTTEAKFASSRAVALVSGGDSCLFALSPDAEGAIKLAGGASVALGCGVFANSDNIEAIQVVGNDCLTATEVITAGGFIGDCIDPPVEQVNHQPDPLGALPEPDWAGCDHTARINITGSADATLSPGVYCKQVSITTSGTVTFEPGIYIFDGAGISITGTGQVIGLGVFFFFTENTTQSDNFDIAAQSTVTFAAPTDGIYNGVFFYQDRDVAASINHNFTGGVTMDIDGIIYAANQDINYSGGAESRESNTFIVADTINF